MKYCPGVPEWRKCPQCGRENSVATWEKRGGKCPNCGDSFDRDSAGSAASATPDDLRELPIGAWFFVDSPACLNRYSVQERTSGGCSIVCSTPYHHELAQRQLREIVAAHNQVSTNAVPATPPPDARTPKDYAIEHAEYLAKAAEHFMDEQNKWDMGIAQGSEEDPDARSDAWNSLRSAIGEFRKRAARARVAAESPQEPK